MPQLTELGRLHGSSLLRVRDALEVLEAERRGASPTSVRILDGDRPMVVFELFPDRRENDVAVPAGARSLMSAAALSATDRQRAVDVIPGVHLPIYLAAARIAAERQLNLEHYRITLIREGDSYVAIFIDAEAVLIGRGNPSSRPGLEVELAASDLRVIRSNFIR
jgi:hypothetical protein